MTREQAIDHLCARAYARDLIGDHKTAQAIGILVETMGEITALGEELRTFRDGITDENALVGCPGDVLSESERGVCVSCGRGIIRLLAVRPEGKGSMSAADFVKGRGIAPGDRLGE